MLKEKIRSFMLEEAYKPMLYEELFEALELSGVEALELPNAILELEAEGKVIVTRKKKYSAPERMNLVVGTVQGNKKGFGFLIPDDKELKDYFLSLDNMRGSMNGDRVIARPLSPGVNNKKSEAEIIRIISRANDTVVGTFESSKNYGFVVPDDARIYQDIFISKNNCNGAKADYKVIVKITTWPDGRRNPEGEVIEVLGHKSDVGTDILSIIKQHHLPEDFSEAVEREAAEYPSEVPDKDMEGRRDLRNKTIITIDGEDAKDLDDAISIEKLSNGNYLLGVHIADVCHYVKGNSALDKEALSRGTSVYLVDRVIPMLPRKLSNGICSLHPKVNRLTLSCDIEIDKNGKTIRYEIYESVINTAARMTYTNVNKILDGDVALREEYKALLELFSTMEGLAQVLNKKRIRRGSIEFEFPETKIVLDEHGKPIDVFPYERGVSQQTIEEFMLVCNETVSEDMYWKEFPFVYRVHETPDSEKIETFVKFIHNFGYTLKGSAEVHPKAMQNLLGQVKGKREERIITTLMLRSLRKARYAPEALGHFGLAAKYYSHFTSPIRRYPDLIIHRIIKEDLHGQMSPERIKHYHSILTELSDHTSKRERVAEEAERDTDDLKKAEYMKSKVGEEFDGIISSVKSFGMFIELENTIEGMARLSNMEDDYYIYDELHQQIIGERSKKTYKIGDQVKIKVTGVSLAERNIDFTIL